MPPVIDRNKCVGCGTCADICNSNIFVFDRAVDRVPQVRFPEGSEGIHRSNGKEHADQNNSWRCGF